MSALLDRALNLYSLTAFNVVIIMLALTTGGGMYFITTGLIHLVALLFIVMAVLRIFYHAYTYDPILEKLVHASFFALLVFAGSHITEYASMMFFNEYQDSVFANVANFYLISTLAIIAGATYFSGINHKTYAVLLRKASFVLIASLLLFSLYLFMNDKAISLEMEDAAPYLYAVGIVIAGVLAVVEVNKVKRLTPIMVGFTTYLLGALVLILVAILPYIFYDALASIGIPEYGSLYISHFLFYAALSLFILAFKELAPLGGVYEDLRRIDIHNNNS